MPIFTIFARLYGIPKFKNMKIIEAGKSDAQTINKLAAQIWEPTYKDILSVEQLHYMFDMMYHPDTIEKQIIEKKIKYIMINNDGEYFGFASYEIDYEPLVTKVHKIYVLPEAQGRGAGAYMLQHIEKDALYQQNTIVTLNVNRFNKAQHFYDKLGFENTGSEDINIGRGYLMEDYIMVKKLL